MGGESGSELMANAYTVGRSDYACKKPKRQVKGIPKLQALEPRNTTDRILKS
jgi:hypothetical protein